MLNTPDLQGYNRLLTAFAIERGKGGDFIQDFLAPPTPSDTQEFAYPIYASPLTRQGQVNTAVGPDGKLNEVGSIAPDFGTGKCTRRGLKGFTLDELKAQPHGDLFANEEDEIADRIDDLRRENEAIVKKILDARKSVSGSHASPTTKWDASGFTGVQIVEDIEKGLRAAELLTGKSAESGNWKVVVPPLVGDVVKSYLRQVLKYTDGQFSLNGKLPDRLANAPVISPGAMANTAAAGQTASVARIWSSDDVYLVYVDPSFARNRRSYTAMAQMRWTGVSPSYAAMRWRCEDQTCLRTHVATHIWDKVQMLAAEAIYVLDGVLTNHTT